MERGVVSVTPLDSFRTRVYVASAGLWLTLDAGQFEKVELNPKTGVVRLALAPATGFTTTARLRIENTAGKQAAYRLVGSLPVERGAYVVRLGKASTWITLQSSGRAGAAVSTRR
jgi:hypothetical protein